MRPVQHADKFPGACLITGEHTDLIDLQRITADGRNVYLSHQLVVDCARLIGMFGKQEADALAEQVERVEALSEEVDALRGQLHTLQNAVSMTLANGAVIDKRTGKPKLRPPRTPSPVSNRTDAGSCRYRFFESCTSVHCLPACPLASFGWPEIPIAGVPGLQRR